MTKMDEHTFQTGLRLLEKHELISIINAYRNEVTSYEEFLTDCTRGLHEDRSFGFICEQKLEELAPMVDDFFEAIARVM